MNPPFLEIKNADVYRKQNKVFSNLNLTLCIGENTAILGANGAGKSTLLKLITRDVYPVAKNGQEICLFGSRKINLWDLRKKIGVVSYDFQNNYQALASGLDVVVSAFFGSIGLHQHQNVESTQIDKATALLHQLEIAHLKDKQFLLLSTGQQRRLLLARAMIHNPETFIFDEPTNGLDIEASFHLLKKLSHLTQAGKTLVLVTHSVHEIIPEISRVILLKEGKVFKDGPKEQILTSENLSNTFNINVNLMQKNGFYQVFPA